MMRLYGFVFIYFAGLFSISAQLSLPDIFTDNMVLQRDRPIHFWGRATPGSIVEAKFSSESKRTAVKKDSTWSIFFKRQRANSDPQSIKIINGLDKITLSNIVIGDIWLCIGQSNMEFPMERERYFKEEVPSANQPLLRFYNPTFAGKYSYGQSFTDSILKLLNTKDFYKGNWSVSNRHTVKPMSAVGYYFGKELLKKEHHPIGLINMAIGGAPIEAFIAREAMEQNPKFFRKASGNWLVNDALPVWIRERGQQNVGRVPVVYQDKLGPNHAYKPGFAYAAGIQPLLPMPIKGMLWYQGESNAQEPERVGEYGDLQELMVKDYRHKWKEPKMPFYWVQLSSIDTAHYKSRYWPFFRDEQRKLLHKIKYGGMAVSSDIGAKDDVHPTNKKDVGKRLARWALNKTYGEPVVASGPLPMKATYKNGKVVIDFNYVAKGLKTSNNKMIRGFSMDGKREVPATLKAHSVEIPSQNKPEFVYYAWQPYTHANLINSEGLPASTFKIRVE